jgi:hypothetical protein
LPNWCQNDVLIRGPEDEIRRYKNRLLRDSTGEYYPWFSTIPLPEFKDEAEFKAYTEKESDTGTLFRLHYRVGYFEVIENSPGELELHFDTAYAPVQNVCTDEFYPKLSILHKYFEPMLAFHGFVHIVKGEVIAKGHEQCEEQDSPWQMYDYKPWPIDVNPLQDKLKDYIVIPCNQLRPMEELVEPLKKKGPI